MNWPRRKYGIYIPDPEKPPILVRKFWTRGGAEGWACGLNEDAWVTDVFVERIENLPFARKPEEPDYFG